MSVPAETRTTSTATPTGSSKQPHAVELERVRKIYPNGFEAVRGLDLTIGEGELMVLVGPSGCGKTTVLRMVAGLEVITSGTLRIDGRVVNDVTPKQRDIAMVFQNYALYPHMTVGANIAFALRLKHLPKREIERRVAWVASMLGLSDLLEKKPAQLSGGQRQRVAMGRAIVREPRLFLMDEPLSNLDAKLRVQMRAEISRLQRHLGVATLFVTHDQTEAMTLGDRIAIMRDGVLQQLDTPQRVYDAPANVFVAEFIGSPAMNLYEGRLDGTELKLGTQSIAVPEAVLGARSRRLAEIEDVIVGIRPEHLKFSANGAVTVLEGDVNLIEALGSDALVHFTLDARRVHTDARRGDPIEDSAIALPGAPTGDGVARLEPDPSLVVGQRIRLQLDPRRLHFFDPSTGFAL